MHDFTLLESVIYLLYNGVTIGNSILRYLPAEVDSGDGGMVLTRVAVWEGAEEGVCEQTSSLLLGQCDGVSSSSFQQRDWLKAQDRLDQQQRHADQQEMMQEDYSAYSISFHSRYSV